MSFNQEKKKSLVKLSVCQFVPAGQGISAGGFSSGRCSVSPAGTVGISMGFTNRVERISIGKPVRDRVLGADQAHVICGKGCASGMAGKRRAWSVVFFGLVSGF